MAIRFFLKPLLLLIIFYQNNQHNIFHNLKNKHLTDSHFNTTPLFFHVIIVHHLLHHFFKKICNFTLKYDKFNFSPNRYTIRKIKCLSHFQLLFFLTNLENVELQIITLRHIRRICPKNRVIRCLGAEFYLAEALMRCLCSLLHRLC